MRDEVTGYVSGSRALDVGVRCAAALQASDMASARVPQTSSPALGRFPFCDGGASLGCRPVSALDGGSSWERQSRAWEEARRAVDAHQALFARWLAELPPGLILDWSIQPDTSLYDIRFDKWAFVIRADVSLKILVTQ
ncbi:MAG: hypothetical protein WC054_00225 [Candidatus Nanopelagicales bacterium]